MASYDFNIDVLFEIFSRAYLKMMTKCRILSKEFKDLTYTSNFMKLHCERTKTMIGYLLHSRSFKGWNSLFLSIDNRSPQPELNPYFLKFLPEIEPVCILATAKEGLVFCSSESRRDRFYICKPSTQQWEIVPSPNPRFCWAKLGVVVLGSNPLWFKIVHISDGVYDDFDPESEHSNEDFNYFQYKKIQYKAIADIRIQFYSGDHGDGEAFDGNLGTLAHAFSPTSGRLHLDGAEDWVVSGDVTRSSFPSAVYLESVAVHEIGHLLGLGHSSIEDAIMFPSISSRTKKVDLANDDIQGIQLLYGNNPNFNGTTTGTNNRERDSSDGVPRYLSSRWGLCAFLALGFGSLFL